jgi:hypothetical protein
MTTPPTIHRHRRYIHLTMGCLLHSRGTKHHRCHLQQMQLWFRPQKPRMKFHRLVRGSAMMGTLHRQHQP